MPNYRFVASDEMCFSGGTVFFDTLHTAQTLEDAQHNVEQEREKFEEFWCGEWVQESPTLWTRTYEHTDEFGTYSGKYIIEEEGNS